jgi:hypothetical protein
MSHSSVIANLVTVRRIELHVIKSSTAREERSDEIEQI